MGQLHNTNYGSQTAWQEGAAPERNGPGPVTTWPWAATDRAARLAMQSEQGKNVFPHDHRVNAKNIKHFDPAKSSTVPSGQTLPLKSISLQCRVKSCTHRSKWKNSPALRGARCSFPGQERTCKTLAGQGTYFWMLSTLVISTDPLNTVLEHVGIIHAFTNCELKKEDWPNFPNEEQEQRWVICLVAAPPYGIQLGHTVQPAAAGHRDADSLGKPQDEGHQHYQD